MLSVNHGGIKYHFLSLWYDSTGDLNLCLLDHWRTLNSLEAMPKLYIYIREKSILILRYVNINYEHQHIQKMYLFIYEENAIV